MQRRTFFKLAVAGLVAPVPKMVYLDFENQDYPIVTQNPCGEIMMGNNWQTEIPLVFCQETFKRSYLRG